MNPPGNSTVVLREYRKVLFVCEVRRGKVEGDVRIKERKE